VAAEHFWATLPVFILAEANLSRLGLGVAETLPSLGNLTAEFRDFRTVAGHPWLVAPALLLIETIGALRAISPPRLFSEYRPAEFRGRRGSGMPAPLLHVRLSVDYPGQPRCRAAWN